MKMVSPFQLFLLFMQIGFYVDANNSPDVNKNTPKREIIFREKTGETNEERNNRRAERVIYEQNQFAFAKSGADDYFIWRGPFPFYGKPWPQPTEIKQLNSIYAISSPMVIKQVSKYSKLLDMAIKRYETQIFHEGRVSAYPYYLSEHEKSIKWKSSLSEIVIRVATVTGDEREMPHLDMDESYELRVNEDGFTINAREVWGALRGLETMSQLIYKTALGKLFVNEVSIKDEPRFKHRGLLVDTARVYLPKEVLLMNLDAMAMNKMNVFHWHIVDDQSFPFKSDVYPELSKHGAFDDEKVYTTADVKEIVEYARLRGIRVIPEFDVPGHTHSWGKSHPEVMSRCYESNSWSGYYGPMDPTAAATYRLLQGLFDEIMNLFPDTFLHLGGDEVGKGCWLTDPGIKKFMKTFSINDANGLVQIMFSRLFRIIKARASQSLNTHRRTTVWQEINDMQIKIPDDSIIHVWKHQPPEYESLLKSKPGNYLFSTCYYLDHPEYGSHWVKYYQCNPAGGTKKGRADWEKRSLGGEGCMWGEYMTSDSFITRTWPLASAVAERLWSEASVNDLTSAGMRIEEQKCRMKARGIPTGNAGGPSPCRFEETHKSKPVVREAIITQDHIYSDQISVYKRFVNQMRNSQDSLFCYMTFVIVLFMLLVIMGYRFRCWTRMRTEMFRSRVLLACLILSVSLFLLRIVLYN